VSALLERLLPDGPGTATDAGRWLAERGLPSPADEWWRYAGLDAVLGGAFVPAARPAALPDRAEVDRLAGRHDGPRLVFVDGAFAPDLSDVEGLPAGLACTSSAPVTGSTARRYDGFQALNDLAGADGARVHLGEGVALGAPVSVVHVATGADGAAPASHPRTTIELERGARATVVEAYVGTGSSHLANARTSIRLGADAELSRYRVVHEVPDAVHIGHTRVTQEAGSTLRAWSVLAGAAVARDALDVRLAGAGASVDVAGLYLPVGRQRHDLAVTVDHAADGGTSRQRLRGVVDDSARGAFSGRVIVQEGTRGNDASQLDRSLLLTPTAEADSRPWLEIFADDVRCTHGATVGELDADALFYLRSRGIPEPEARRLLVAAFVDELLGDVEVPTLRTLVAGIVGER
jgi:Fe-S cluster assembly protein SufD